MTNRREWKIGIVLILAIALLVAVSGLLVIRKGDNADHAVADHDVNPKVITMAGDPVTGSGMSTNGPKAPNINEIEDLDGLLAELMMTNDVRFLEKAQLLFPDDLDVMILSALWADSADSQWLAKLETLQSDNALPNLIRASLHADESNLAQFAAEMEKALAKPDLDTHFKERLARKLDGMLLYIKLPNATFDFDRGASGEMVYDQSYGLDSRFVIHQAKINNVFSEYRDIIGNEDTSASLGLAWAKRLQGMSGLDLGYRSSGLNLEGNILARYDDTDLYGENGVTVGERRSEIQSFFLSVYGVNGTLAKFDKLIGSNSDSLVKMQFFARLATDGESSAVNWLNRQ